MSSRIQATGGPGGQTEAAQGLDVAEEDFEARRRIIEMLNLQATLVVEDEQEVIYARCMLGEEVLSLASDGSGTSRRCRLCSAA